MGVNSDHFSLGAGESYEISSFDFRQIGAIECRWRYNKEHIIRTPFAALITIAMRVRYNEN